MMIIHKHTYEYVIEDGVIVRNDTNKHFRTMKEISDELNRLNKHTSYSPLKDKNGNEYVSLVGFSADYYDVAELCELLNAVKDGDTDKKFEKHCKNNGITKGHYTKPYRQGRFHMDHTLRKGFWLEDWLTGKVLYFDVKEHIGAVVGLLNDYTDGNRYTWHDSNVGNVIEDKTSNETFVLGDSKDIGKIRDLLNDFDFELYGERVLPYKHLLM